jgi:hypothetical protein
MRKQKISSIPNLDNHASLRFKEPSDEEYLFYVVLPEKDRKVPFYTEDSAHRYADTFNGIVQDREGNTLTDYRIKGKE